MVERRIRFTDGSDVGEPVHLFDSYHDYTLCNKSVYADEIKGVKCTMRGRPKGGYCKQCVKEYRRRK